MQSPEMEMASSLQKPPNGVSDEQEQDMSITGLHVRSNAKKVATDVVFGAGHALELTLTTSKEALDGAASNLGAVGIRVSQNIHELQEIHTLAQTDQDGERFNPEVPADPPRAGAGPRSSCWSPALLCWSTAGQSPRRTH